MGILNLTWFQATDPNPGFSKEELAAGWPDAMRITPLANMQDPMGAAAFLKALALACQRGDLPHSSVTYTVYDRPRILSRGIDDHRPPPQPQPREVTEPTLTATAFAAWLAGQGETPSKHVKAWFDAVLTSVKDNETIEKRNARWLDTLVAKKNGMNPPSDAAIYREIEAAEGIGWETVKKAVARARKEREDEYTKGNVKSLPGLKKSKNVTLEGVMHLIAK